MKRIKITVGLLLIWLGLCACAALTHEQVQPCPPSQLAALEAAYVSETTIACKLEGAHSRAECKAYPALQAKYQAQRAAYVECSQASP